MSSSRSSEEYAEIMKHIDSLRRIDNLMQTITKLCLVDSATRAHVYSAAYHRHIKQWGFKW